MLVVSLDQAGSAKIFTVGRHLHVLLETTPGSHRRLCHHSLISSILMDPLALLGVEVQLTLGGG